VKRGLLEGGLEVMGVFVVEVVAGMGYALEGRTSEVWTAVVLANMGADVMASKQRRVSYIELASVHC
jgi:hypothetical protein